MSTTTPSLFDDMLTPPASGSTGHLTSAENPAPETRPAKSRDHSQAPSLPQPAERFTLEMDMEANSKTASMATAIVAALESGVSSQGPDSIRIITHNLQIRPQINGQALEASSPLRHPRNKKKGSQGSQADVLIATTLVAGENGISFWIGTTRFTCALDDPALLTLHEHITARNGSLGIGDVAPILAPTKAPALARRTTSLPDVLRFFNDPVHGVTVLSLARIGDWTALEGLAYGFQQTWGGADISVGLPKGDISDSLWELLRRGGPAMVKGHYALWARYYEAVESGEQNYIEMSVPQFCADIGLKKHHKGGFRREQKQQAMRILEGLASLEIRVTKTLPNKKKLRLRGPIWNRGIIGEQHDQYTDLLGAAREGNPETWEPLVFSFMPGPWFDNAEWRKYHKFVGKIGAGLMKLENHTDQWAILIGGYLGAIARANKYNPLKLRIGTILDRAGLAQSERAKTKTVEIRDDKFFPALDKLKEVGVIEAYKTHGFNDADVDMHDLDAVAEYGATEGWPEGDWRNFVVEITLPNDDDRERLKLRTVRAIEHKQTRRGGNK